MSADGLDHGDQVARFTGMTTILSGTEVALRCE